MRPRPRSRGDRSGGSSTTAGGSSDDADDLERNAATVDTPLLGGGSSSSGDGRVVPDDPAALYRQNVVILCFASVLLIELGANIIAPPLNAILERNICREYHPQVARDALADDPLCKYPDVQGRLAMIRGWGGTFDCIPGILGAVPYGILSDTWGRRPVLVLSLLGITLSIAYCVVVLWFADIFPVWTVWFSSLFLFIGGSPAVAQAMLYTFLSDVVPLAAHATVFFQVMSVDLLGQTLAGPVAGMLMRKSDWLPLMVGLGLLAVGTLTGLVFPETLELKRLKHALQAAESSAAESEDDGALADAETIDAAREVDALDGDDQKGWTWRKLLATWKKNLGEVWEFVLGNKRVTFLMVSLVFTIMGRLVNELLLQYATKRYDWSWDKASIFLTVRTSANMVTLLLVLPAASWACLHYLGMSAVSKDLWLARFSSLIQVTGAVLVAFAYDSSFLFFALVIFAAGGGLQPLLRSLAIALVEEHHVGILNSLVGFMEMVGMMISGPLLAQSLRKGLEMGGAWIGLPFLCAGLMFTVSAVIVWSFRVPRRRRRQDA
ncbi:hypothetical protein VTK73DRAFT_5121 [Phialemonium thermophilum]|uniref:Major facilitator superfamily (MFS) profile domain-containing protein n=1 Tax=Phialemonium thermophilum TaxID=223376 RepID=A0ABR3WQD1_9PEZI